MQTKSSLAYRLALFGTLLAFVVVMLGAYTRLKNAGLGCPDWPGCYGQIIAPNTADRVQLATQAFPGEIIDASKAWKEMIHRYVAGTVAVLILILAILAIRNRRLPNQPIALPFILVALVIFQALLGKWTVTMKLLPLVVMSHLLGGMAIFTLLWLFTLSLSQRLRDTTTVNMHYFRPWAALGIIIVITQIFLGGWVSANYSALACPDFPTCYGQWWPAMDYQHGFQFLMPLGPNFEGGVLNVTARVTIQVIHRLGALITTLYLIWLACWMLIKGSPLLRKIAWTILLVLSIQITLGMLNVIWLLPAGIAVSHNAVAALLLLTLATLNYCLYVKQKFKFNS